MRADKTVARQIPPASGVRLLLLRNDFPRPAQQRTHGNAAHIHLIDQFADVRVSEEWARARPKTMNNKGIVDNWRRPKLAYATVKRIFREAK